jgi:thiamine monophosphate kinase
VERSQLATSGEDYTVIAAIAPGDAVIFETEARRAGLAVTQVGTCVADGFEVTEGGRAIGRLPREAFDHFDG